MLHRTLVSPYPRGQRERGERGERRASHRVRLCVTPSRLQGCRVAALLPRVLMLHRRPGVAKWPLPCLLLVPVLLPCLFPFPGPGPVILLLGPGPQGVQAVVATATALGHVLMVRHLGT